MAITRKFSLRANDRKIFQLALWKIGKRPWWWWPFVIKIGKIFRSFPLLKDPNLIHPILAKNTIFCLSIFQFVSRKRRNNVGFLMNFTLPQKCGQIAWTKLIHHSNCLFFLGVSCRVLSVKYHIFCGWRRKRQNVTYCQTTYKSLSDQMSQKDSKMGHWNGNKLRSCLGREICAEFN